MLVRLVRSLVWLGIYANSSTIWWREKKDNNHDACTTTCYPEVLFYTRAWEHKPNYHPHPLLESWIVGFGDYKGSVHRIVYIRLCNTSVVSHYLLVLNVVIHANAVSFNNVKFIEEKFNQKKNWRQVLDINMITLSFCQIRLLIM